ncbi:uncharacterized protein [Bemisia tabaci]|uniref:uncharacterized protein n=1 Tax=Bemisia tabaci TaxID=7038 RepID=UPI003B28BF60
MSPLAKLYHKSVKRKALNNITFPPVSKEYFFPRHSNAWEEDKLGPWACRTTHRNNCSTTCTATSTAASTTTSTATSTSSTCIDSSTGAMMSGRNNNQFRRGAAIRRHIEN